MMSFSTNFFWYWPRPTVDSSHCPTCSGVHALKSVQCCWRLGRSLREEARLYRARRKRKTAVPRGRLQPVRGGLARFSLGVML